MVNKKLNTRVAYALLFFTVCSAVLFLYGFYDYNREVHSLESGIYGTLVEISNKKGDAIEKYLIYTQFELMKFQKSAEAINVLGSGLVADPMRAKADVDAEARIIAKEVENYLRRHTGMSLTDLQRSEEFKKVAVQPVGKDGYSLLGILENASIALHKSPELNGRIITGMPELEVLIEKSIHEPDVSGFYEWKEPDGQLRRKYARFLHLGPRTADGVGLKVVATAYVDDYLVSSVSPNISSCEGCVLISKEGYVISESSPDLLGTNLEWLTSANLGFTSNYFAAKASQNITFFGPYIGMYGDIFPDISGIVPIYGNGSLLGYAGIVLPADRIFATTIADYSEYATMESYIVNGDKLLMTPVRNRDLDILVQSIETDSANECFGNIKESLSSGISARYLEQQEQDEGHALEFLNYRGEQTFGVDYPVPAIDFCILTEVSSQEVHSPLKQYMLRQLYIYTSILCIVVLMGFFAGFSLSSFGYSAVKKIGKALVAYGVFNWLTCMRMRCSFMRSLIFFILYTALWIYALGSRNVIAIIVNTPSLAVNAFLFALAMMMFIYGFKLKEMKSTKLWFVGCFLIALHSMVATPLDVYINNVAAVNLDFMVPAALCLCSSLVFLLFFVRRNLR
jgi:hypothetical protein